MTMYIAGPMLEPHAVTGKDILTQLAMAVRRCHPWYLHVLLVTYRDLTQLCIITKRGTILIFFYAYDMLWYLAPGLYYSVTITSYLYKRVTII